MSGPGGAILRTFDIHTGAQLLEKQLHPPEPGHHADPDFFGQHVVFGGDDSTDIYVLTNGDTCYRMDGRTGEIHWQFSMPDARYALQEYAPKLPNVCMNSALLSSTQKLP